MARPTEFIERKYTFSDEEKQDLSQVLAAKVQEQVDVEQEKATVVAQFNGQIKEIKFEITTKALWISQGFKVENVECYGRKNFATGDMEYYSVENHDLIKSRPLTTSEMQTDISDDEWDSFNKK